MSNVPLGHLSSKSVNSKTASHVRLNKEDLELLPYVSVTSVLASGADSKAMLDLYCDASQSKNFDTFMASPEVDLHEEFGDQHFVDSRIKQLLIPMENGEYLSISPLESSGLMKEIQSEMVEFSRIPYQETKQAKELSEKFKKETEKALKAGKTPATYDEFFEKNKIEEKIRYYSRNLFLQCDMPIGGANSQNVSKFCYVMKSSLMFKGPKKDSAITHALSILNRSKGHASVLQKELDPIVSIYKRYSWKDVWGMDQKNELEKIVSGFISKYFSRMDSKQVSMMKAPEKLDLEIDEFKIQAQDVMDKTHFALFFPEERDTAWGKQFSSVLLDKMIYASKNRKEPVVFEGFFEKEIRSILESKMIQYI